MICRYCHLHFQFALMKIIFINAYVKKTIFNLHLLDMHNTSFTEYLVAQLMFEDEQFIRYSTTPVRSRKHEVLPVGSHLQNITLYLSLHIHT